MPILLWNPKVRYRAHNSLPLVSMLCQMHPVHTFPVSLRYILILSSVPRSSKWSLPFKFSDQNVVCLFSPMRATSPTHLILLDLIAIITFGYKAPHYAVFSSLPTLPFPLGPNTLLSTLFSRSSLYVLP